MKFAVLHSRATFSLCCCRKSKSYANGLEVLINGDDGPTGRCGEIATRCCHILKRSEATLSFVSWCGVYPALLSLLHLFAQKQAERVCATNDPINT